MTLATSNQIKISFYEYGCKYRTGQARHLEADWVRESKRLELFVEVRNGLQIL
jgi:hypothetical protein